MKKLSPIFASILFLAAIQAGSAGAHPPAELQNFVGAKGGQAEMGLQNLGYVSKRVKGLTSFWWKAGSSTCVKIVTSNGRYKSIDIVGAAKCGMSASAGTGPGAGCPSDVSEANRYLYPDCDKPSAGSSGDVPNAALAACRASADSFQGVTAGTSSVEGAAKAGSAWVLKMSSGGTYKSTCKVTPSGQVLSMSPGN